MRPSEKFISTHSIDHLFMSEDTVSKVKSVLGNLRVSSYEEFEKEARQKLPSLPEESQKLVESTLNNPEFKKNFKTYLMVFDETVKPENIKSAHDLVSDAFIQTANDNLGKRDGFEFERIVTKDEKITKIKIHSDFLKALATLITKIAGLF
jgi:hypothetical protein